LVLSLEAFTQSVARRKVFRAEGRRSPLDEIDQQFHRSFLSHAGANRFTKAFISISI
jgi:hypothetical protein